MKLVLGNWTRSTTLCDRLLIEVSTFSKFLKFSFTKFTYFNLFYYFRKEWHPDISNVYFKIPEAQRYVCVCFVIVILVYYFSSNISMVTIIITIIFLTFLVLVIRNFRWPLELSGNLFFQVCNRMANTLN